MKEKDKGRKEESGQFYYTGITVSCNREVMDSFIGHMLLSYPSFSPGPVVY